MKRHITFKRHRFYTQNKQLIDAIAKSDKNHTDKGVGLIIKQAREEIGYAKSTTSVDIYMALVSLTPTFQKRREQWMELRTSRIYGM